MEDVVILGSFSEDYKGCISIDNAGQAKMTLTMDATQLPALLKSFAQFKDTLIEITLKPITEGQLKGSEKEPHVDELPSEG